MYLEHTPAVWAAFTTLVPGILLVEGIQPDVEISSRLPPLFARARSRLVGVTESELPEVQAWRRAGSKRKAQNSRAEPHRLWLFYALRFALKRFFLALPQGGQPANPPRGAGSRCETLLAQAGVCSPVFRQSIDSHTRAVVFHHHIGRKRQKPDHHNHVASRS
jgi:hypothetical protein